MNADERAQLAEIYNSICQARLDLVAAHDNLFAATADLSALLSEDNDSDDRADYDDNNDTIDNESVGYTLTCEDCGHEFAPERTPHVIVGPWSARYNCPNCGRTVRESPPNPD
jgi:rubrerythrin